MIHVATISQAAIASCLRAGGCSLRFVGLAEDEFRIDAEDALGAIEGLEVRRVFSGWGFYRRGLLFAAAWEGDFASVLGRPVTGYMRLLTESCWAAPTSLSVLRAGSSRGLRRSRRLPGWQTLGSSSSRAVAGTMARPKTA